MLYVIISRNRDKKRINQIKMENECKAVQVIKSNPRFFYSYAKTFQVTNDIIGFLRSPDGSLTNDPLSMANLSNISSVLRSTTLQIIL